MARRPGCQRRLSAVIGARTTPLEQPTDHANGPFRSAARDRHKTAASAPRSWAGCERRRVAGGETESRLARITPGTEAHVWCEL